MTELKKRLGKVVAQEGFYWGKEVGESYHEAAAKDMDQQWTSMILPILSRYPIRYEHSVDFAGGYGRNTRKLLEAGARKVVMVDINPDCVREVSSRFQQSQVTAVLTDGTNLSKIRSGSQSFLYTFDAMVHFDPEVVAAYIPEFYRVLESNSYAFIHHSNYSHNPGADFRNNPHWRNFMTMELFHHFAVRAGFKVVEQCPLSWEISDLDCLTLLHKP